MVIKILLLVVFFAIMIGVGIYSRTQSKDVNGFVLGGRSVGPWLTAFAYGTSYFSAVVFIGYAGQFGWKYGISSSWIGLGNAFLGSLLAWVVMGRRTRIMTQHLDAKTMPDFFGKRYDSTALRVTAAVIAFIFLIPYTASLYKGLSTLFNLAFPAIRYEWCVVGMAVLTAVYVILGGYMATAINDFIQGIIMLAGIIAVIAAVLHGQGGFLSALNKLSQVPTDPSVTVEPLKSASGLFASMFGPDPLNLFGVIILTSLGTWGLPQMVGKFYSIKSEKSVKTGTVVSTVFAVIVSGGCYFLGGFGRLFEKFIHIEGGKVPFDNIIPSMLSTLPDVLIGVVVVLVLSASMSTLSSLVLTSSSTLTLDMLKITCMKKSSEKKTVFVMRVFIVIFIAISVIIALNPDKVPYIAQLMGYSWGALAGAFLAPFLYGLFSKKITKAAVWTNFIWGVGLTVANMFCHFIKSPINCGAIAMVGGLVIVPLVSLITPKMKKETVDEIFSCYDEKIEVTKKVSLPENEE